MKTRGMGGAMKARGKKGHLTAEELTDFARGTGSKDRLNTMKQHLQTCGKCAKVAETWHRVAEAAHRLPASEPPESVVRVAKSLYSAHSFTHVKPLKSWVAELLSDSSLAPAPAGIRSYSASPRQLLFGAGDYRIDIRFAPQQDADQVLLLGQVLHTGVPVRATGALRVVLFQGGRLLGTTETNYFGEFQLQCELQRRLELKVMLPDEEISIPLVEPFREKADASPYVGDGVEFRTASTKGKDRA